MLKFKKIITFVSNQIKKIHPRPTIKLDSTAVTDTGLVRDNNEDSYLSLPEHQVWAVADGMGGCESGEIASAITINRLKQAVVAGDGLVVAIQSCHHEIEQALADGLGTKGMGSTIVVLKINRNRYHLAWVGDSRCYLWRSKLTCLSKDHSYIQLMLDQGLISESEIDNHPYQHAITQALGGTNSVIKVDCEQGELQVGDIFLLCSDGLHDELTTEEMDRSLSCCDKTLEEKAKALLAKALSNGGKDNIALILVEVAASGVK